MGQAEDSEAWLKFGQGKNPSPGEWGLLSPNSDKENLNQKSVSCKDMKVEKPGLDPTQGQD